MQKNDNDRTIVFVFLVYGMIILLALGWRNNWC